jgi:hypothetical protein
MVKADIKILHHTFNEEKYKFQFLVVRVKWSSYLCLKELLFKATTQVIHAKILKL